MISHSFLSGQAAHVGMSHCVAQSYVVDQTFYGQLHSKSCQFFGQLIVYGDLVIYQSSVNKLSAYGQISFRQNSRANHIDLYGNRAYINQSQIGSLDVFSTSAKPVIYINHSHLHGVITFKNQKGVVLMDQYSSYGQVINGEVKYV